MKKELTAERARELLDYEPGTGRFIWKVDRRCGWYAAGRVHVRAGTEAGTHSGGYRLIGVDGTQYLAHRLAVLIVRGRWPPEDVDHLNGDRDDNRWANLRECTRQVNAQNLRKARSNNRTGVLGVIPSGDRWVARITVNRRRLHLGCFSTPAEAHAAYIHAKRRLHIGCVI
jgi:hypothetical protein